MQRRPSHLQPATGRARWAQWPASHQSGSRVAMMAPNLGATPLAQNGISPQRSATSSVPFCPSAAPSSMRRIAGTWVAGCDVPIDASDLVADAREVPVAFDVAFFGGDVAAAHGKSASAISEKKMSKTVGGSHSAAGPISRPAVLMRHRDDLQPLLRYPVHQRERKPAQ